MIGLMFTLDYEIYGNGQGDLTSLVIEPTKRLLDISNEFNAKVTIFAEVAEFLEMKKVSKYKVAVDRVEEQLRGAIRQGHDVQLHLHPQWFGAEYQSGKWELNYDYYSIAKAPFDEAIAFLSIGKEYLENLLRAMNPDYKCLVFRAGNWCMMPSQTILKALKRVGFESDSSVFKWGKEEHTYYSYDYSTAHSNFMPWFTDIENINKRSTNKDHILEIPIYTEKVTFPSMLTKKRLLLQRRVPRNNNKSTKNKQRFLQLMSLLFKYHPKKFDFCKLKFTEMKDMISNLAKQDREGQIIPISAIGHSKEFVYEEDYKNILMLVKNKYSDIIDIDTYSNILARYKAQIEDSEWVKG